MQLSCTDLADSPSKTRAASLQLGAQRGGYGGPRVQTSGGLGVPIDIAIRGATVVAQRDIVVAGVGIDRGLITSVGSDVPWGRREIDARGMVVLPGGIDPHVHLSNESDRRTAQSDYGDDFATGSRAAAAGGITTFGCMIPSRAGEQLANSVLRAERFACGTSLIDFFRHPEVELPTEQTVGGLRRLWTLGYPSVKMYMMLGDFEPRLGAYIRIMNTASESGVVVLIHCEWGRLLDQFA